MLGRSVVCNITTLLVAVLFIVASSHVNSTRTLSIGVLYSGTGIFSPYGKTVMPVMQLWMDHVQNRGGICGYDIQPVVYAYNIDSNASLVKTYTQQLIEHDNVTVIFAPETSLAAITAQTAAPHNIPIIAAQAGTLDVFFTPDGQRRFPFLFGVMSLTSAYYRSFFPLVKTAGMGHVIILTVNTNPDVAVARGARDSAADNDIVEQHYEELSTDLNVWRATMIRLATKYPQPEAVILCHRLACVELVELLVDLQWSPQALSMYECATPDKIEMLKSKLGVNAKYIITPQQWDARMKGADFSDPLVWRYQRDFAYNRSAGGMRSAAQFDQAIRTALPNGLQPTSITPGQYAGCILLEEGVCNANSTNAIALRQGISQVNTNSFYGLITVDTFGVNNIRSMCCLQIDDALTLQIIAPETSATLEAIMHATTWNLRSYVHHMYSYLNERQGFALVAIHLAIGILLMILTWLRRTHKDLVAASVPFTMLCLFAYTMGAFLPFVWPLEQNTLTCIWRVPYMICVICCFMGPIVARTWRISRIFGNTSNQKLTITNRILFIHMMALCSPLLVTMIVWIILQAPFTTHLRVLDPMRPALDIATCTYRSANTILIILLVEAWLLLAIASVMAYRIRHAYETWNDAKSVGFFIWMLLIMSIVVTGLAMSLDAQNAPPQILYWVVIIGWHSAFTFSTIALMVNRLMAAYSHYEWVQRLYKDTTTSAELHKTNNNTQLETHANETRVSVATAGKHEEISYAPIREGGDKSSLHRVFSHAHASHETITVAQPNGVPNATAVPL